MHSRSHRRSVADRGPPASVSENRHRATPSTVVSAAKGGCARVNFCRIIDFPLLVGPHRSKLGMRVRLGKVNKSSKADNAASARAYATQRSARMRPDPGLVALRGERAHRIV